MRGTPPRISQELIQAGLTTSDSRQIGLCTGCGKENLTALDWSSEWWCFVQSDLSRPKPAR
jgi:hypothetical protein